LQLEGTDTYLRFDQSTLLTGIAVVMPINDFMLDAIGFIAPHQLRIMDCEKGLETHP